MILDHMTAHGGEPPDYIADTPQLVEDAPRYLGDQVTLPEHRPANQRCAKCGCQPEAEDITDFAWNTWTCPHCGHVNATDFSRQPARTTGGSF